MRLLQKSNLVGWRKAQQWSAEGVINHLKNFNLRGRGGANFAAGLKWELAKNTQSDEKFVICNADEGEPGTFKDKFLLENNPETVIEGILIAAWAVGAKQAYIYLRGEYSCLKGHLEKTIKDILERAGTGIKIDIVEGAGAYICGDETAIISSIENKRGYPSFKPPYPPQKGLFGKPTVIHNVETLANVPISIVNETLDNDLRLFSISGDVSKPGVYELRVGITLGEIAKLSNAKNPKAVYFGASGGCIPYSSNFIINPENVAKEGAMLGSCSLIFVGKGKSILDLAINIAEFFKHESCGKCTPCREGNIHLLNLLLKVKSGKSNDLALLEKLSTVIRDTSLCGLGQSCANHVFTELKHFKKELK